MDALINIIAVIAFVGGLVASLFVPWWAVWLICLPVMCAGGFTLLARNTDYIQYY